MQVNSASILSRAEAPQERQLPYIGSRSVADGSPSSSGASQRPGECLSAGAYEAFWRCDTRGPASIRWAVRLPGIRGAADRPITT
jgi:hypothetical protein